MKKIYFLSLFAFFLISCGDDDNSTVANSYDNLVRFLDEGSISVSESSRTIIDIPIVMNNFVTEDVTVSYSLTGDASNYELYETNGSAVTIPSGARQAFIRLRPVDNDVYNDPLNTLVISITGVSGADAIMADTFNQITVVFGDDDCPPITPGTYSTVTTSGNSAGNYTVEITALGGGKYQVSDITMGLYTNVYGAADNPGVFTQSSCNLTIVEDESPDVVYGGDWFFGTGTFNGSDEIMISWANYYGDNGRATLTLQ